MSRILFINSVCNGSTGTICKNLYKAAEEAGHKCCIAYGRGDAPEGFNTIKIGNKLDIYLHVLKARMFDASGFGSKHATKNFIKKIEEFKPDVIHLHNIHGYYVNVEILFEYLKSHREIKKIWTLHDCWAFTGHCAHYLNIGCYSWYNGCSKCSISSSYPKSFFDRSKKNFFRKKRLFTSVDNLKIISVSDWLTSQIEKSFLNVYKIITIKNGIDIEVFRQVDSTVLSNEKFNEKKIILGVANVWNDSKGLDDFIQLSRKIKDDYIIILIGRINKRNIEKYDNIYSISSIENPNELVKWYTRAYVFFNPTKGETFGLTNYEAQACGTPVVTYNAGGTKETILLKNSYVVNNLNDFILLIDEQPLNKSYDENIREKMDFREGIRKQIDEYLI